MSYVKCRISRICHSHSHKPFPCWPVGLFTKTKNKKKYLYVKNHPTIPEKELPCIFCILTVCFSTRSLQSELEKASHTRPSFKKQNKENTQNLSYFFFLNVQMWFLQFGRSLNCMAFILFLTTINSQTFMIKKKFSSNSVSSPLRSGVPRGDAKR